MRVNIPDDELEIELTHSWFSKLSFILSFMMLGSFFTLYLQKTSIAMLITKQGLDQNMREIINIFAMAHNDTLSVTKALSGIGIILGIIGLFKRDHKRSLALISIILNALALFLFFTWLNY